MPINGKCISYHFDFYEKDIIRKIFKMHKKKENICLISSQIVNKLIIWSDILVLSFLSKVLVSDPNKLN